MEDLHRVKIIKDLGMIEYGTKGLRHKMSLCLCPVCNNEFETIYYRIKNIKSCNKCSGKTHNMSKTKLYTTWINIKNRCTNIKNTYFHHYGGRGITICSEWENDFMSFYNWSMNNGYKEELTIDRINVNGNYEPLNCRWTNKNVQASNIRPYGRKNNTSGYKGLYWNDKRNKWSSSIQVNKKSIFLGLFENKIDAINAYNVFIDRNNLPHTKNSIPLSIQ